MLCDAHKELMDANFLLHTILVYIDAMYKMLWNAGFH